MLHFIRTLSLSVVMASGTILFADNAIACGGGTCAPQANYAGYAQAGVRTRYQSGYQAPTMQPHYHAPMRYHAPAWQPLNNNLPKADPRRFSRGI